MAVETQLIPVCGFPIFKIKTGEILNEDELKFFKSLAITPPAKTDIVDIKYTESDNVLNNIELKRIKKLILENFSDYVDNILEIENQFYICNSWGTTQKKGDFHPKHAHTNAIFSSVFYVHAENSSLIFNFDKSNLQEGFYISYNVKNFNFFNSAWWGVPVETGDLVIFPAQLQHESKLHEGDTDRMIIGANFFLKGKLGTKKEYNFISI